MKEITLALAAMKSRIHTVLSGSLLALSLIFASGGSPALAATAEKAGEFDSDWQVKSPAAQQFVTDARQALRNGDSSVGLALLRKAVNAAPKDGGVRALLGWLLLALDDPASAERELRQARRDGAPEHFATITLFQAMIARNEEQKLLDEFPEPASNAQGMENADILHGRAMALLSLKRMDAAATTMDRSLSLHRDVLGLVTRARIARWQNNLSLANRLADEALKLYPSDHQALGVKLAILVALNDYTGALKLTESMLLQSPNDILPRLTRVDVYLRLKQDDKAMAEAEAVLAKKPRSSAAHYYQALILARANNLKAAWNIAQSLPPEFVQSQPSYAVTEPHVSFAAGVSQLAIQTGNVETGAAVLAAALGKSPDDVDLRLRLADLRLSQDSPETALTLLLPLKDSSNPHALALLAQTYLKLGKFAEASGVLRKMQKTDPQRAISLLISALHLEPSSVELLDTLGWVKLQQKDSKGALEQLTRAHSLRPGDGAVTFHLVQALDANGNRKAARDMLKTLLDSGVIFDEIAAARQLANTWH